MPRLRTFQDDENFKKLLETNNFEDYYETYLQGKEVKDSYYSSVSEMLDEIADIDQKLIEKECLLEDLLSDIHQLTSKYAEHINTMYTCKSIKESISILIKRPLK
jgi:hypothetical protein